MRNRTCLLLLLIITGCSKEPDIYLTPDKAAWYFSQVETYCYKDNGSLWGGNIYGPLMFIDRETRKLVSNMPDSMGILKLKDGVYTGSFPREMVIANGSVYFGGTLFALAPLPQQEDTMRIKTRAVYGLFQSYQKRKGLEPLEYFTGSMDEKAQRLLLKLEWRALRKALLAENETKKQLLRDALIFRGARREQYPSDIVEENRFETYRGLPTFTAAIMCFDTDAARHNHLVQTLDRFYGFQSFSRSYGIIHGALYAFLAFENGFDFKTVRSDTLDLADLARSLYEIELPEICRDVAGSLALNYDLESVYREEEERLAQNKERMHRQISVFTEKPVVFIDLESPYFDYEPEDIRAVDTLGTIYTKMRISDNWGKLTVEKVGCLVSYNLKTMRITARNFRESKNHFYGDGWHLILNNNWEIAKEDENYHVRKLMP